MRINTKLKDWNLRHKIILHVVVIGALATGFLAYTFISAQNNMLNELNRQRSDLVASMMRCNIIYLMHLRRAQEVPVTFQRLIKNSQIKLIRIADLKGKILKSSEENETGNLMNAMDREILARLYTKIDTEDVFTVKPVSPKRSFMAIENETMCLECHNRENTINSILIVDIEDSLTRSILKRNKIKSILIAFTALIVLIFVIVRLFEKIINKPVSYLKEKMRKIQEGDLDICLEPKKNDEIGDLTISLNVMVRNLRDANDKIEKLHSQQIEKAGHLASVGELAAGLAHEIKNPIAGVKGALEVIMKEMEPSDSRVEIFGEMIRQVERINDLVQDLLRYARPMEIHKRMTDPRRTVLEALRMAESQTKDKDISFVYKGLEKDEPVYMDGDKIQKVILNLLVNSIAAIDKKGEISVFMKKTDDDLIEIVIEDNGTGIPEDKMNQIFNPFFTTRKTGTGLGLSICENIIKEHQGRIEVESHEGRGTCFKISFPVISNKQ